MLKTLLTVALLAYASLAQAVHYDVRLGTSNGPVAGSKITVDFYGDYDLAGKLPVDTQTGYKIFPGYFDDLEGGPRLTDDPGFQSFANTFKYGEEVHFRALGSLSYWDPASASWGSAGAGASVTLYGGIPVNIWLNYMLNPGNASYAAQYNHYAGGTVYSGGGVSGPLTALIDGASQNGTFHSHLDWKLSDAAAAGAYMLTLQVWSPTTSVNGEPKYLDSDPFHVVFKSAGISQAQFDLAFEQRIAVAVPEADTWSMLLLGLGLLTVLGQRRRRQS
ncbi:PEP-CTERM sorting domain-containing protein [Methylobacillus gramineus]|uniref:PEP-CTERM sorting domain-containing protein n=1 Tax=Methylobacillus gramineus TaxID=755169 RepID=UPI001D0005CF|nr:PEP-CTERM sorting domain-containing protein [Methylobacillus gramineus]MCB5185144.1 PEP-CTERM sorting domain-containing protein [Methylobacillus gramineus]